MTYREQNFSGDRWKTIVPADGSEFVDCNFSQAHPGTAIFTGFTALSFLSCNIKNVALQTSWVINDCNTCQAEPEPETVPTDTVKEQATALFEQIKPLAYQDPAKVNEALNDAFTPEEINGVLSARSE